MITAITPLFILGIIISTIGVAIGFYFALREKETKTNVIPIITAIAGLGLFLMAVDIYQEYNTEQKLEQMISEKIENMSCVELHDALLHNKINGTNHVQRATERYVAGCESK